MGDSFNPFEFAAFLRARWHFLAITCGVAVGLSLVASLLLPKRYTATATILISPPAGNDPRAATALSPIYLESLRAYERLASNDTLFVRALDHFHVREDYTGKPVESLKRRILQVTKVANTELLEISATLGDARTAQGLAQFIAEQTCEASRSFDMTAKEELTAEARRNLERAQVRVTQAEIARNAPELSAIRSGEEKLWNASELRARIEDDLTSARTELAGATDSDAGKATAAKARVQSLEEQDRAVTAQLENEGAAVEKRKRDREAIESEWNAARVEAETAKSKLNEIAASSAFRGERLQIIDPGIVPQQPSSPIVWLNVAASLIVSLTAGLVFAALKFSRRTRIERTAREYSFP
jgi:succinoglycan biosynthesis transport protein ExoP